MYDRSGPFCSSVRSHGAVTWCSHMVWELSSPKDRWCQWTGSIHRLQPRLLLCLINTAPVHHSPHFSSRSHSLTLPASLSAALFFCFAHTSFYSTRRSHPICFTIYLSHLAAAPSDLPTALMSIWAGKSAETARDYCMCVQATSSSYPCSYNLDRSVFQSLQCPLHFNSVDFAPVHSGSLQKHRIPR